MTKILSHNINCLMAKKNISTSQLALATNIPASTIKKIRNSSNTNPTLTTLIPLARYFSVSLEYLISDNEQPIQKVENKIVLFPSIDTEQKNCHPFITWEQALHWPYPHNLLDQTIQNLHYDKPRMFALKVENDNWNTFPQDTVLLVEPTLSPKHRDYVVTSKEGHSKANLKQFLCDDENKYLKSLSIAEETIAISEKHKIIGVVIECWRQLVSTNMTLNQV